MNFEITAIRYQMPGKDFEEKTKNAKDFVAQLPIPSMVYLNNSSLKFEIMAKQLYVASQRVL